MIFGDLFINVENPDREINKNGSQLGNISEANSSAPILGNQGKKKLPIFSNLAKQKKIMNSSTSNEVYELQEQQSQTLHVPLHGSSSRK